MKISSSNKALILVGLIAVLLLGACKKGKDDPAFTLASRKARVSGDWKLEKAEINFGAKDTSGSANYYKYMLTQSSAHYLNLSTGVTADAPASIKLSFTKTGEFNLRQTIGPAVVDAKGTWDFLGKGRGYKNKERIEIRINGFSGYSDYLFMFNMTLTDFSYTIKELRNKKMVLVAEQQAVQADQGGFIEYITAEYTFTQ